MLYTDASDYAIGYVLGQKGDDNKKHVIRHSGRSLSQRRWPNNEKECLAIIEGVKHFQTYLEGDKEFLIHSDHQALQYLKEAKANKSPKLLR